MRSMLNLQFLPAFQYGKKFMLKIAFLSKKCRNYIVKIANLAQI